MAPAPLPKRSRDAVTTIGTVLRRLLAWGLVAVVIANAVVVVRDFSGYIGSYPYLALDDSLANVSFSLASAGRYGFLASPLQAPTDIPRHDGFFNYGPWYFYLGAALTWLFGYSLSLLRAIHLGAILLAAGAAFWWFRDRRFPAAAAIFGLGILHCFQVAQWPMVRPDVIVSLFALALAVSAGLAFRSGSGWHWFLGGFAASSGAFTHLIAWSLVPACGMLFFIGEWLRHRQGAEGRVPWRMARNLGFVVGGGIAGAVVFYASFGFRVSDHLSTLVAYKAFVGADRAGFLGSANNYIEVLAKHYRVAYDYLPESGRFLVAGSLVAGWLVPVIAAWRRPGGWLSAVSFVLPPVVIWSLYLASLGLYPNFHGGYAILNQVMAIWTGASVLHAISLLLQDRRPRWTGVLGLAAALAAISWGLLFASRTVEATTDKATTARRWVNIQAYLDEVLVSIPTGARAWGTVMYGIENPRRLQLVQFGEAARLAGRAPPQSRESLAPDYIVWGYAENRDSLLGSLEGKENLLQKLETLFPQDGYRLVKLVHAAPYGAARVYQRTQLNSEARTPACKPDRGSVPPCIPTVGFYHPETGQWARAASDAIPATPGPVPAQQLRVGYDASVRARVADRSLSMDLPPGDYLLGVSVSTTAGAKAARVILATSVGQATQTIGELGPDFDSAPYTSMDTDVFLAHRHAGGALVVSQLDGSADAEIRSVVAHPVEPLRDFRVDRRATSFRPMPPLESWLPDRPTGVVAARESGSFRVRGNDSAYGYQFISPALAMGARRNAVVRLDYAVEQGRVCTGILNEAQTRWIVTPGEPRSEIQFNSGASAAVHVVFANCNLAQARNARTIFTIRNASYSVDESENVFYTDQLMKFRQQ